VSRSGTDVIALSDGAGSAKLSHFGAECIVHTISDYLADHFEDLFAQEDGKKVKQELLAQMRLALTEKALALQCDSKALAATILVAAVHENQYIAAHIGDGVIGCLKGNELKVASAPDNGEFANVTTFVTSGEALASMRLFKGSLDTIGGFVLMSDGTEQSLYHKPTNSLATGVIKLMQRTCLIDSEAMERQLESALTSVIVPNTLDDCSIAILARPLGMLQPLEEVSAAERMALLQIGPGRCANKRMERYDTILQLLVTPQSIQQIAQNIHLAPKYTKQHLNKLLEIGVIQKVGAQYVRV
jgi:hypothetical protein